MSKAKLSKEEKKAAKAEKKAAKKANGGNPEVSSALIQCISAVLCVAIVAFGASTITDKINANKLEIAGGTGTSDSQSAGSDDAVGGDFADDTSADIGGDVSDDTTTADDFGGDVSDDTTASDSSSAGSSSSSSTASSTGSKSGSSAKKAMTSAEYLKIYNDATKKVADKKLAFSKTRSTKEIKYEAGLALKSFKSIVYKFMGVGDANKFSKTVTSDDADSYFKYFLASSLTASDVTKVVGKDNGNSYTIQIALKDGSSAVTGGKVTQNSKTALDKCGIACGEKDKDYWDHKPAENIYSAISEVPGCGSATIKERYSNAVVTMEVTKDGKLTSLSAKFSFHVDIDGVMGSSGVAEAESVVTMNNFKW